MLYQKILQISLLDRSVYLAPKFGLESPPVQKRSLYDLHRKVSVAYGVII